ncbi:very short patch repair endonuclease [Streptomyces sp. AV19]|uniref:very short patch repair endonuclease n=1 Tax=Streptomyces sp. AV19 TaxID=2793068 RepID=UPI0018FE88C0|nr:very short patch repair endonuclease [Streptomyces sp. AV19]MBH1932777.1 very short patch repair endonuclease [Streptomyces sp. AV19]MDG4531447.1 very short patch repair endonuclease [Streptomyces sp. AV19]
MSGTAKSPQNPWNDKTPPDRAWKGRPGRTRAAQSAEQDRAAGGSHQRLVDLGDGRFAHASVSLRLYAKTRRIRATLRWGDGSKSPEVYLGEVEHATRAANLAAAWERARAMGLLAEETLPKGSKASSPAVRASMRGNRGRDTKPEMLLRSLLHREGLRYRVNARPIKGLRRSGDVVFPKQKVVVFVDGCFWHVCPEHHRPATRNTEFWNEKFQNNQRRDIETTRLLEEAGWTVIRAWEHEAPGDVAQRVIATVRGTAHRT